MFGVVFVSFCFVLRFFVCLCDCFWFEFASVSVVFVSFLCSASVVHVCVVAVFVSLVVICFIFLVVFVSYCLLLCHAYCVFVFLFALWCSFRPFRLMCFVLDVCSLPCLLFCHVFVCLCSGLVSFVLCCFLYLLCCGVFVSLFTILHVVCVFVFLLVCVLCSFPFSLVCFLCAFVLLCFCFYCYVFRVDIYMFLEQKLASVSFFTGLQMLCVFVFLSLFCVVLFSHRFCCCVSFASFFLLFRISCVCFA